jgi:hypothetical protein
MFKMTRQSFRLLAAAAVLAIIPAAYAEASSATRNTGIGWGVVDVSAAEDLTIGTNVNSWRGYYPDPRMIVYNEGYYDRGRGGVRPYRGYYKEERRDQKGRYYYKRQRWDNSGLEKRDTRVQTHAEIDSPANSMNENAKTSIR